jgi:hypothetical protein
MVKFIINKYFITNYMVLRRTGELHATDLQILICKFFCTQKGCEEMFLKEHDRLIGIFFNLVCKYYTQMVCQMGSYTKKKL